MMYDALSEVYDFFAYDFDYDLWTDRYETLIKAQNPYAREICDCGCGTGSIAVRLAERGYKVTGVDLSTEMLARAGDKARRAGVRIPFVRQDMRFLTLPHPRAKLRRFVLEPLAEIAPDWRFPDSGTTVLQELQSLGN